MKKKNHVARSVQLSIEVGESVNEGMDVRWRAVCVYAAVAPVLPPILSAHAERRRTRRTPLRLY
jgi:hypothetical protein